MEVYKVKIVGTKPLLMHSRRILKVLRRLIGRR